jgi:hypothetical protein
MRSQTLAAVLVAFLCVAGPALAQGGPTSVSEPTYGTANRTVLTVPAWEFVPRLSSTVTDADATYTSRCINASSPDFNLRAGLHLPNGALLERISIEGCDFTDTDHITLAVDLCPIPSGSCLTVAATTGDAFDGGCDVFPVDLGSPIEIDNTNYTYFFEVQLPGGCNNATFRAARAAYRLQVSPAPLAATFNDVPLGHPQRQFIEALAAAGIASECATVPLRYCPNDPVTRGQMAVFLAKALGLHWPP